MYEHFINFAKLSLFFTHLKQIDDIHKDKMTAGYSCGRIIKIHSNALSGQWWWANKIHFTYGTIVMYDFRKFSVHKKAITISISTNKTIQNISAIVALHYMFKEISHRFTVI